MHSFDNRLVVLAVYVSGGSIFHSSTFDRPSVGNTPARAMAAVSGVRTRCLESDNGGVAL